MLAGAGDITAHCPAAALFSGSCERSPAAAARSCAMQTVPRHSDSAAAAQVIPIITGSAKAVTDNARNLGHLISLIVMGVLLTVRTPSRPSSRSFLRETRATRSFRAERDCAGRRSLHWSHCEAPDAAGEGELLGQVGPDGPGLYGRLLHPGRHRQARPPGSQALE